MGGLQRSLSIAWVLALGTAVLGVSLFSDPGRLALLAWLSVAGALRLPTEGSKRISLLPGAVFVSLGLGVQPASVAAAALFSSTLIAIAGARNRRQGGWTDLIHDCLSSLLMVALWTSFASSAVGPVGFRSPQLLSILVLAWLGGDAYLRAVLTNEKGSSRLMSRLLSGARTSVLLLMMVSASATFVAMWSYSPTWAIAVALGPFAVTYSLVRGSIVASEFESLTIRAIGRLPEAAGLSQVGHSADTARLAMRIAMLNGLSARDIRLVERAALLHDVGLLCVTGNNHETRNYSESQKAEWGAELLQQSSSLQAEANVVRRSGELYRMPGHDPDRNADRRSQILRVCCAFTTLVAAGRSPSSVVESLYEEPYHHAPWAVETVREAHRSIS